MKVQELIAKLKKCNPKSDAKFCDVCCNQDFFIAEVDGNSENDVVWIIGDEEQVAKMENELLKIAQTILDLETLETRNSDSLDFHEIAVWRIKDALEAAYIKGRNSCRK